MAAPIPRLAPVTNATFPFKPSSIVAFPPSIVSTSMPGLAKRSNFSRGFQAANHNRMLGHRARFG